MDGRTNGLSNADTDNRLVATTPHTGGEEDNALGGGTRTTSGTARSAAQVRRAMSPGLMSRPLRRLGLRRHGRGGSVGSLGDLQDLAGIGPSEQEFSVAGEAAEISMEVPIVTRSLRPAAPFNDADSGGDDDEAYPPSRGSGGSGGIGKTHRGAARLVKNLSVGVARRLQGRSMGGSGAMTIGRASLSGRGAVQREGLRALPDLDDSSGDGALHSTNNRRRLPAEWPRSVPRAAVLTPSESSSAGPSPPPRQHQHHPSNANPSTMARGVSAPTDTRSHSRRLSGSSIGGLLQQLHPRTQALETSRQGGDSAGMRQEAAASAIEVEAEDIASGVAGRSKRLFVSSRRSDRRGSSSPVKRSMAGVPAVAAGVQSPETFRRGVDSAGMGQETAASATEVEAADTASARGGRSRRLSVSSRRSDRRGSLSPVKRFIAGVAAVAAGVQSPETSRRGVDSAGMGYEATASAVVDEAAETASARGRRSGRLSVGSRKPGRRGSVSPTRMIAGVAAAMAAGTRGGMERGRSTSPKRGDERELLLEGSVPIAIDTFPNRAPMVDLLEGSAAEKLERKVSWHADTGLPGTGDCVVEPAPPSTLKYGDRLRLWASVSASGSGVSSPYGGGYVGSVDKVKRVKKKLFRRSETAAINSSGETIRGFIDCHFKAVDPEGRHSKGEDVCLGETVLLVDDRGFVWNYNTAGNASSVRVKPRGSAKYPAAVHFRLPIDNKGAQSVGDTPVVFGNDGLEIVPVEGSSAESRRLRVGSRSSMKYQHHHALTVYAKKYGGSSRESVMVLCGDGRGEQTVFGVHLPNASPAGDPSPVVTKVIIHANELQTLAHPLAAVDDEEEALSSETSPTHGPASGEHAASQPRPRSGSVGSSGRPRGGSCGDAEPEPHGLMPPLGLRYRRGVVGGSISGSGRPRGGSCGDAESHGLIPPLELRHRRGVVGGSISGNGSKAGGTEVPSGQVQSQSQFHPPKVGPPSFYLTSEGDPSRGSTATATATSSVRTGSVVDDEDDEDQEDEFTELGTFEGLKWGEFVQFKLPGEGEVPPDDPMLTIMLSNGCSASVSSKQLRENDGRDSFPVSASPLKSVVKRDSPSEGKGGTVYIRCTLTPLACCHETEEAVVGADAAGALDGDLRKGSRAQGSIEGGGDVSISAPGKSVAKGETAKRWTQTSCSLFFVLASLAAIILSAPAKSPNFLRNLSTLSLSSSGPPAAVTTIEAYFDTKASPPSPSCSSTTSPSLSVCTSVWDLRQPDGTEYPHQQLSAAATAFEAADPRPAPTAPAAADRASLLGQGNKNIPGSTPRQEDGSTSGGIYGYGAGTAAQSGVSITRTSGGVLTSEEEAPQGAGRGWARACAFLVAILAAGVVIVDRLFGSCWAGNIRASSMRRAPPMQARVHLLQWDARSISETRAAAEALLADGIYHTPPSGSELAPMPNRFAVAENMNMAKAWARWEATLTWRKENAVDYRLSKPHPRFSLIKSLYPHCFHLADKGGRVTYYERPGLSDFAELKKAGITKQELVEHYVYCMEYLWQVLQPKQSQKVTIIIDLDGVKFRDLAGESVGFLKTTVGIMSRHYPQRSFKILILNAPSFFNTIFSMVKTLLNEATKKKIEMLPVSTAERGMLEVIPPENLPPQYGGTSQVPLMQSPAEAALRAHVVKILEKNGQTMEPVAP